jgi:hypothetical protein
MKNLKQFLFLALLSSALFSCSDSDSIEEQAAPIQKSIESTLAHGNILFKQKTKKSLMYTNGIYDHSFSANVVSSSVTSIGDDITISSPANEGIAIYNAVRDNGSVTFDLATSDRNGKRINTLTGATMDEMGFDNLVSRNCPECADAMLISLIDLATHDDSNNTVQKAVSASQDCEANGGIPELSLEYGFFNNTSVFSCN